MKHLRPLSAWNKHEPWWGTVTQMVLQHCAFKNTVSDELWRASGIFCWPLNHRPKIQICLAFISFFSLTMSAITSFISFSTLPKVLMSYLQCSWKVCRHRSLQSSWWGSCIEQWSAQRSLPPLQLWTDSWLQTPGNAGLEVWMHMDGTPGNLTTTQKEGKKSTEGDKTQGKGME